MSVSETSPSLLFYVYIIFVSQGLVHHWRLLIFDLYKYVGWNEVHVAGTYPIPLFVQGCSHGADTLHMSTCQVHKVGELARRYSILRVAELCNQLNRRSNEQCLATASQNSR